MAERAVSAQRFGPDAERLAECPRAAPDAFLSRLRRDRTGWRRLCGGRLRGWRRRVVRDQQAWQRRRWPSLWDRALRRGQEGADRVSENALALVVEVWHGAICI